MKPTLISGNRIAEMVGEMKISDDEMDRLLHRHPVKRSILPGDAGTAMYGGRTILFRRYAARLRLIIFDGAHEGLVEPMMEFLAKFSG